MKKLAFILTLIGAVLLTACQFGGGVAEAPTLTPLPTSTPLPTATPMPEPSPTATFLPSPTPIPEPTATPEPEEDDEAEEAEEAAPPPPAQNAPQEAVLAFGANLREGPATEFESLDLLSAGETVTILGRDFNGFWLLVSTTIGQEGWVALRQFQGPIDVARIPQADDIPDIEDIEDEEDEEETDEDEEEEPVTPTVTPTPGEPLPEGFAAVFGLDPDDSSAVCQEVSVDYPGRFLLENIDTNIPAFDAPNAANIVSTDAYVLQTPNIPLNVGLFIQGEEITPFGCNAEDGTCNGVTMTLCASASSNVAEGGYNSQVTLEIGTQSYSEFFVSGAQTFGVSINVFR